MYVSRANSLVLQSNCNGSWKCASLDHVKKDCQEAEDVRMHRIASRHTFLMVMARLRKSFVMATIKKIVQVESQHAGTKGRSSKSERTQTVIYDGF